VEKILEISFRSKMRVDGGERRGFVRGVNLL